MPTIVEKKITISGSDLKLLWEEVKANAVRLRACGGHRFGPLVRDHKTRYRCAVCMGEAEFEYVLAYCEGFAAAGGDPKEVAPNYEKDQG